MTLVRYRAHDLSLKDNFGKGEKGYGPGPEYNKHAATEASSDWPITEPANFKCPAYQVAGFSTAVWVATN